MCGDVVRPGPPPFLCMWPSSHPAPPSLSSVVQHLLPHVSAYTYTPVRSPDNTIQMPKLDAAVFPGFLLLLHASHLARISLLPIYLLKNLCLFLLELSSVFIISSPKLQEPVLPHSTLHTPTAVPLPVVLSVVVSPSRVAVSSG